MVHVDELGSRRSPGLLDTTSRGPYDAFFDVMEWCAEQEWSSKRVGLLDSSCFLLPWGIVAKVHKLAGM